MAQERSDDEARPAVAAPADGAVTALTTRDTPYPMSRLAPRFDLVDVAAEIARADETMALVATAKLDQIRSQIRALQDEARRILDDAAFAARLHRARCSFRKVPGRVYHLYDRGGDDLYFSMLSPAEWRGAPPHAFEGSYRLEADQTFTRLGPPGTGDSRTGHPTP